MIFYPILYLFLAGRAHFKSKKAINDLTHRNGKLQLEAVDPGIGDVLDRRSMISSAVTTLTTAASLGSESSNGKDDTYWPLWPALPIFPFSQRKTLVREVSEGVWTFDVSNYIVSIRDKDVIHSFATTKFIQN